MFFHCCFHFYMKKKKASSSSLSAPGNAIMQRICMKSERTTIRLSNIIYNYIKSGTGKFLRCLRLHLLGLPITTAAMKIS